MNITNEPKDKYQHLIDKGYTTNQIAEEMKVSWSSIKRRFRELGLRTTHWKPPLNIKKEALEKMVSQNYSTHRMARELGCSQGAIKHWLKKWGMKTNAKWTIDRKNLRLEIESGYKTCSKCHIKKPLTKENFYMRSKGIFHYWCKECNDKISLQKQTERKRKCVEYKGGKCIICGYNKYLGSLDFHHVDPAKKDYNISNLDTYSLEVLQRELDKCLLVCRNCHGEIHGGLVPKETLLKKMVSPPGIGPGSKN